MVKTAKNETIPSSPSTSPSPRLRLVGSNRPERKTALVARELVRYKVDIAALSETRFSEQGQLEEMGAGYTFFWGCRPKAERRDAGVSLAIRNDVVGRLPYRRACACFSAEAYWRLCSPPPPNDQP
nr:unnamed protein product [Spirometra erinaceieuropaei]